jgi:gamma-glutamyl-gamma-aminobutyrate hydrolase PuuD
MNILISCRTLAGARNDQFLFDSLERGFYSMFAGHAITALLNIKEQNFEDLADANDLLVLSGGDGSPLRLQVEIEMIKQFRLRHKPILGVCHGAFLLTQLWGGECIDIEGHRGTEHPVWYKYKQRIVNSYHGSAITSVPTDARVLVTDDNGYIESWHLDNVMAVVWHPERDLPEHWMPDEFYETILIKKETLL